MTFVFVSGRPALDFVGTLKWRNDDREEQLRTVADLRSWVVAARLLERPPVLDEAGLALARAVREAVYRAVAACMTGARPRRPDVELLNRIAAAAPVTPVLTPTGRVKDAGDLGAVLSTLARDAIQVIGDHADRLRRCANARCTRIYLDTSRAGNRRWCGMTECGNTAKVAAFRKRHRPA